ncbi:MAG: TraR/DksA C4-type zinc finger protein [Gammaproteobacteria bacterium]
MSEHDEIENILSQRRIELEKRLSKIEADLKHKQGPLSQDFAEQAVEQENTDVLYALNEEGQAELRQISRALDRIQAGTFGLCVKCGDKIAQARLKAVPHTQHCLKCITTDTEQ